MNICKCGREFTSQRMFDIHREKCEYDDKRIQEVMKEFADAKVVSETKTEKLTGVPTAMIMKIQSNSLKELDAIYQFIVSKYPKVTIEEVFTAPIDKDLIEYLLQG